MGPVRGEVRIVEFSDFRCGHCGEFYFTLKELRDRYPDHVTVYYRHLVDVDSGGVSFELALASECADAQGVFEAFHNAVFETSVRVMNRDQMARIAKAAGVRDLGAFEICIDDRQFAARVDSSARLAKELGLPGTPASNINGRWVLGSVSLDSLDRLVSGVLRAAEKRRTP